MKPIKISPSALDEIKNIFTNKNIPSDYGLRIGVKGSGCAGVDYIIGFDQITEDDESYDYDGITILLKKKDLMHLIGLEVDFVENSDERGFVFN